MMRGERGDVLFGFVSRGCVYTRKLPYLIPRYNRPSRRNGRLEMRRTRPLIYVQLCSFGGQRMVLEYSDDKKTNNDRTVQTRRASHPSQGYDKPRAEAGVRIRGFVDGEVKEGERAFMRSNRVAADSSS